MVIGIDRKLLGIVNYMQNRGLNIARLQICLTPWWKLDLCNRVGQSEEGKNNPKHVTILFQEAWKQTFSKWIWKEWDEARGLNLSCSFVTDLARSTDLSLDKEKTLTAEFCQSLVRSLAGVPPSFPQPPPPSLHHTPTPTHTPFTYQHTRKPGALQSPINPCSVGSQPGNYCLKIFHPILSPKKKETNGNKGNTVLNNDKEVL